MKTSQCHLGFIGFGHMAQVIFKAIDQAKLIPRSQILFLRRDPLKMRESEEKFGITAATLETLVERSHLLLLCVRPRDADAALKELARIGLREKMLASVLAGVKISFYQKYLGPHAQILRVMPNIASAVGEGMSLFTYASGASAEFKSLAAMIFSSMGEIAEVKEVLMDIGTGMAGSGPGFVFRLIEAMAQQGVKEGIEYPAALKIAAQTFAGAAKLILKGALPVDLIHQIATPGGTTQAGFDMMKKTEIEKHFQMTVEAAAKKSKEFSEEIF